MSIFIQKKLQRIKPFTLSNLKNLRVKTVQGINDENKGKRNAAKSKLPYNFQPTDKYLRPAEHGIPPGTPGCLNVNVLLETKSNLLLTIIARSPGS